MCRVIVGDLTFPLESSSQNSIVKHLVSPKQMSCFLHSDVSWTQYMSCNKWDDLAALPNPPLSVPRAAAMMTEVRLEDIPA